MTILFFHSIVAKSDATMGHPLRWHLVGLSLPCIARGRRSCSESMVSAVAWATGQPLHQRSIHVLTQDILHSLKRKILRGRKLAHSEIHNNNKIKQNQIDTRKSEPILCEHMSGVQQMRQWHQLNTIRHFCATLSQNYEICWNGAMLRPNARPCSLNIFSVALIIAGNGSCVGHLHFGHHHPIQSSL